MRLYRGNGSEAWNMLRKGCKRRPGFQILISDLISNRKICNKNILGNITKAMNIQLNLSQFDESKTQKLYVLMALNGLRLEIEIFFFWYDMVETKTLDEIKREMIRLKSNTHNERNKDLNWNMHSLPITELILLVTRQDGAYCKILFTTTGT